MIRRWLLLALTLIAAALTIGVSAQPPEPVPATDLADENGQFISVDGIELYYIEAGPTDGPAVMLLHGFGGSTFTWRETVPALAEAGYRVIAYDRPPYGLAEKSTAIAVSGQAYAEQLAALMDALEIDSAVLVGHSAGGDVIARFAVDYPQRVDSLVFAAGAVVAGTGDGQSPVGGLQDFANALDPTSPFAQQLVRSFLTEARFIDLLSSAYHPDFEVTEDIQTGYAQVLRVQGWEIGFLTLLTQGDSIADPIDLDALAAVETPVLLIWGQDDAWVPVERGEALRQVFPAADWVTLLEVGHLPMEEAPDDFNAALLDFLSNS